MGGTQLRPNGRGGSYTQSVEGFWSLVKRGIGGTHHSVLAKQLQGYLNEHAGRHNHRKDLRSQFETRLIRAMQSSEGLPKTSRTRTWCSVAALCGGGWAGGSADEGAGRTG